MENLFKNDAYHQEIDEKGVVSLPFLNASELQEIRDFYHELHPDGIPPQMRDGIHMTIWCADRAYKDRVREKLRTILDTACARHFKGYRICAPVFIVKRKGSDTTFPIHQDWNVVDEAKHRAFNVWVPLQAVDAENGSLWHVPGSHQLPTVVRGPGLLFPDLYGIREHIVPAMKSLSLAAGEAMLFYHRLIHGSPPNTTENPRVVVSFSLLPKEVPMHIYFQKNAQSPLQVYHPHDFFIYEFDNLRDQTQFIPPNGKLVAELPPYQPIKLTPALFDQHFPGLIAPPPPKSFWQRVLSFFSRN